VINEKLTFFEGMKKMETKTEKKTYRFYVRTDEGYFGLGQTLKEALKNANYHNKGIAHIWEGKGITWTDGEGATADGWENDGQSKTMKNGKIA